MNKLENRSVTTRLFRPMGGSTLSWWAIGI